MGFDPRRWRPSPPGPRPVTANVEALLAENEALRREVLQLREQLQRLRRTPRPSEQPAQAHGRSWQHGGAPPGERDGERVSQRVSRGATTTLTPQQVERWTAAMAHHPAWEQLRIGPPGGLRGLVERCRSRSWNPAFSLEQELDRRQSGLGAELREALRGPHSRGRWAVRAAFALYGPAAIEWLSDEPLRVVAELLRLLERLEPQGPREPPPGAGAAGGSQTGRRRGTRTANTSWAAGEPGGSGREAAGEGRGSTGSGRQRSGEGQRKGGGSAGGSDRSQGRTGGQREALALLGLEPGASLQMIKSAYRRLAKAHHPDLGGKAEAFQQLDAAYRLLLKL